MINIALTAEFSLPLTMDDERHGSGHQVVYGGRDARRRGPRANQSG
jgi:hypothetical protein